MAKLEEIEDLLKRLEGRLVAGRTPVTILPAPPEPVDEAEPEEPPA